MSKTTLGGLAVFAVAFFMFASNLSDAIGDLKNWHDAQTPEFVALVIKHVAMVGLAALGGTLMPQPRAADSKDRVSDEKLQEINK